MRIYVGGVNGVGKSTVLASVLAKHPDWKTVHMTGIFMDWLGFGQDYTRLRALPSEVRDRELAACIQEMMRVSADAPCFYDSHYLNMKEGKIDQIVGPWLSTFDGSLLISCPTPRLFERLQQDTKVRERGLFPKEMDGAASRELLETYAQKTRDVFVESARTHHLPAQEIVNTSIEEAAEQVISFVERLRSMA